MPHIRTQIRQRFKAVLEAALPVEYSVYSSRKYSLNINPDVVMVDMRFLNDQTREREVMSDARIHVGSLYIRIQRTARETDMDDVLDADEVRIVKAIEAEDFLDLLEEDPEMLQVNFSDEAVGDKVVGAIVIRYDVEYRIDKTDPETRID